MSISLQCTNCGKTSKAKEELAGKRVKCPACGQVIMVSAVCPPSQTTATSALPGKLPDDNTGKPPAPPPLPVVAPPPLPARPERRRVRWPWYAGIGAVTLCVVAGVVLILAVTGNNKTVLS